MSERTAQGTCIQCGKEASKRWRSSEEGKKYLTEARRKWALENADRLKEYRQRYREKHPDKVRQSAALGRAKEGKEERIARLENMRRWHALHPEQRARYRPMKNVDKKRERNRQRSAKLAAAYRALKELGIEF